MNSSRCGCPCAAAMADVGQDVEALLSRQTAGVGHDRQLRPGVQSRSLRLRARRGRAGAGVDAARPHAQTDRRWKPASTSRPAVAVTAPAPRRTGRRPSAGRSASPGRAGAIAEHLRVLESSVWKRPTIGSLSFRHTYRAASPTGPGVEQRMTSSRLARALARNAPKRGQWTRISGRTECRCQPPAGTGSPAPRLDVVRR